MIKIILVTAIVATVFTGCVGTLTANNDIQTSPSLGVQNAKGTLYKENNSSIPIIKKKTINKTVQ